MVSFSVLGPLVVRVQGSEVPLSRGREALLLALLLSCGGAGASLPQLINALWEGAEPRTAAKSVQVYVHRLRRKIGGHRIPYQYSRYHVAVSESSLDALNFVDLADRGRDALARGEASAAARLTRRSLGLWRGDAYTDFESNPAVSEAARYLNERRLIAVEDSIEAELELGRHPELIPELTSLTTAHPLRERFREQLMLALHHSGRRADALLAYQHARRHFLDEVGVEPSAELQRLHQQILTTDGRTITPVIVHHRPAAATQGLVPAQLPPVVPGFVGRSRWFARAGEHLARERSGTPRVLVCTGIVGVGKSAFVSALSDRLRRDFSDGQLYVDLRASTEGAISPPEALARLLRSMGVDRDAVPPSLDERANLWRSVAKGRKLLVVLDDALDEASVRPFLATSSGTCLLVTSRCRLSGLEGSMPIELPPLEPVESESMLTSLVPDGRAASQMGHVRRVAMLCGHLPLALRIVATRLVDRPDWTVREMAERLTDDDRVIDELSTADLNMFDRLSQTYEKLDPAARAILATVGHTASEVFVLDQVLIRAGIPLNRESDRAVENLVRAHLIERSCVTGRSSTYRSHRIIRAFARRPGSCRRCP